MRRKQWIIAVAVPLTLVVGDLIYWRITAERLRTGFQDWIANRTAQGWDAGSGTLSIGGWPQAATVRVSDLVLRHNGTTMPGNLSVVSADIALSVSLFNPTTLHLSLSAPTHLRVGDAPEVVVSGEETLASMPLRQSGPRTVAIYAKRLRLEPATGGWHVTAGLLNGQLEISDDVTQPAALFTMSAEAIALPASIKWPLGANISSASMDARLNGPIPAALDITHWAENWRDGGGSLEVTHFTMGWGPLGLTSSATLALDEQLQPMGSGNGHIVGYAESLDRLASAGLLTKSAVTAAKAVLSLLAGATTPDEPSSVDVPLTLQYRTLSMRQVPLLRLPELDWPTR